MMIALTHYPYNIRVKFTTIDRPAKVFNDFTAQDFISVPFSIGQLLGKTTELRLYHPLRRGLLSQSHSTASALRTDGASFIRELHCMC